MKKTFKVKSDIDDLDEVQEITAATTPMKINRPVCVTCNKCIYEECKPISSEYT